MRRIFILLLILMIVVGCGPTAEQLASLPTRAPLPQEVQPLLFWETASGNLSGADDIDYWQFGGVAGDQIFIRTIRRGADVRLQVLQGSTIILDGVNELQMTLPATESYRLQVIAQGGASDYDIGLGYSDRPDPSDMTSTPLPATVGVPTPTPPFSSQGEFITQLNETREFTELLTATSPQHVYTIQGIAGQIVNFELYRIAGTFDPVLRFYDADGNLLAMDDNSLGNNNARLLNLRLPETGLYTVQVDGKDLFGDYTLIYVNEAIEIAPDVLPTNAPTSVAPYATPMLRFASPDQRLDDHTPVLNSIVREGDFQRFSFFADAGERVSLVVSPLESSQIIPQFEIFDPDGVQIALASALDNPDDNLAAVANSVIIGQTGAHILIVTGASNTIGQFTVAFGRGATVRDVFQGFLPSNDRIVGVMEQVGSRHIWQLPLDPGDVISVAVSPNDDLFNPVIELVTAEGDVIYTDDDGGVGTSALLRTAEISTPATYLLRVYDQSGANRGSYTVLWNYVDIAPTPTPIPSLANLLVVNGDVDDGQYQFYAFQGQAGQRVRIEAVAADGTSLDPVIAVLNPAGEIILEADDSPGSLNPSTFLTLPDDGTYQVRVNGYLSGGDFTLSVAQVFD